MFGVARLNTLAKAAAAGSRTAKTITNGGGATVSTTQSKFGGSSLAVSISAGASSHYLSLANATTSPDLNFGTGNFTYECWVYPVAITGAGTSAHYIIDLRGSDDANAIGFNLSLVASSTGRFIVTGLGSNPLISGTTTTFGINTWYHVAVTRSGTTLTLWVNGASQGTATSSASVTGATTPFIGRGVTTTTQTFRGYIEEVRFSNTARYTATFTPSASAFTNDANTVFLMHADGANGSTTFTDDNA